MAVNKYKLRINQVQDGNLDREIILPIPITTDEMGRGDLIREYEDDTIAKLVGLTKDYEVTRYTHSPLVDGDPSPNIFYDFNFGFPTDLTNSNFNVTYRTQPNLTCSFNDNLLTPTTPCVKNKLEGIYPPPNPCPEQPGFSGQTGTNMYVPWDPNGSGDMGKFGYELQNFSTGETYRNEKSFVKSFFKLDLYDSPIRNEQQLYISLIINPINGEKLFRPTFKFGCPIEGIPQREGGRWNCQPTGEKWVPSPTFQLDPLDNNEGYYIYWLKEKTFLDLSTFYMSCKFYNGKTGIVTSFLNTPQNNLPTPYSFPTEEYFYYRVKLNQNNYTYTIYDKLNSRIGATSPSSIKFYEYFNSP